MEFAYDIIIEEDNSLVRLICSGALNDAQQGEQLLRDVVKYAAQQGLHRILVDIRALELAFSGWDMMDVMINMREEAWLQGMRIARLLGKEDFSNLLIADISATMGLPMKNFASEQQAITWLKESE